MKKTLLALTVAAVATSAQAQVELYKDDASSVKVKGTIATFAYQKDVDNKVAPDTKTDLDVNAWAKAQFDFEHKVTDTLVAGGTFEIQSGTWVDGSDNNAEFDDVAAYLKGDFGLVGIGEIGDISDSNDAVTKTDILNELDNNYLPKTASDSEGHGVSYTKEFGALTAVVDAYTESNEHVDNTYGASLNYQAEIFSVGAMYQTQGDTVYGTQATSGTDSWALGADFTAIEGLTLAASYNVFTAEDLAGTAQEAELTNVTFSASYAATDAVTLYGVYGTQDKEVSGVKSNDADDIILGASYAASDLLTVFTELASRTDHDENETTEILVGAYFDF
ncbi:porin [Vibrio intestinalis]|uniref:porin n=1 Tax=Vibrio intestinalis TaxID=2933291 RepID=UPI0021A4AF1D|nr:hypothetical protein [Vibrio intestinalis]